MFTKMTEAIWHRVSDDSNDNIKLVAMVPMSDKDRRRMVKRHGDNGYTRWVIALVNTSKGEQSILAWGINNNGNSDTTTAHLSISSTGSLMCQWHQWIAHSQTCLIDYIDGGLA